MSLDVPVGFIGQVRVTRKHTYDHGGHSYLLAILRDGKDTGLRLMAYPIHEVEFQAVPDGAYEEMT